MMTWKFFLVLATFGLALLPETGQAENLHLKGTCLIIGNGPERYVIEALAKEFETLHPETSLDFFWHENARPGEVVQEGKADIAIAGEPLPHLESTIVAWDGIAVVANFANPIDALTSEQLAQIFSGKLNFWSEIYEEGPETKIRLIHRTWNQNIRQSFEKLLGLQKRRGGPRAKVVQTEVQAFKAVNGDIYSLTYVSMGPALQAKKDGYGVTLLFVDGIEPEYQTVLDSTYPLRRPVIFAMKKNASPIALAFRDFVLSPKGQRLVKIGASGLFHDKRSAVVKYYPLQHQP